MRSPWSSQTTWVYARNAIGAVALKPGDVVLGNGATGAIGGGDRLAQSSSLGADACGEETGNVILTFA